MPIDHMLNPGRTLSSKDIEAVETQVGRKLPEAYVAFLLRHNGGKPEPAAFFGPHPQDEDSVHFFYRVDSHDANSDLLSETEFFQDVHELDRDLLPIARTPQGNLICIAIGERKHGQVFFWSHDAPDRDASTFKLADDLGAFLESFHELEL